MHSYLWEWGVLEFGKKQPQRGKIQLWIFSTALAIRVFSCSARMSLVNSEKLVRADFILLQLKFLIARWD